MIRAAAVAVLALVSGCGGGCNTPSPSSETCTGQAQGTVATLEIGHADGDAFTAYHDGDVIPITYGGQGFPMLVVNLRATGAGLGDCLPQSTTEYFAGQLEASEGGALVIEEVEPGTWVSGQALLVSYDVYGGERVRIESTAGGVTTSVDLWVDYLGERDAGAPDAATDAATDAASDAAPPDAMP